MVAIAANRYETKPFWGLVEQVGPWKTTKSDKQRSLMKDHPTIGGGIEAGGRSHAGHGQWTQIFTPYQNDASPSVSSPSDYAMRSVVTGPIDMKRQTKMGRVKKGVTLAARTPLQSGEKMGMSTQTENVETGQRLGTEPGEVMPDLVAESSRSESSRSESDYGLPPTAPFLSEHQIEETHEWMNNSLSRELHTDVMQEPSSAVGKMTQTTGPSLSIQKTGFKTYKPKRGLQATQTRERTFQEFGTQMEGPSTQPVISSKNKGKNILSGSMKDILAGTGAKRLKQAREELRSLSISQPPSFRYKKSFEPSLAPIKEEKSTIEKARQKRKGSFQMGPQEVKRQKQQPKGAKRKGSFQMGPLEVKRQKQQPRGAERLKQAREELRTLPISQPASFRYKKSFKPSLAPIKEVRSVRERARPLVPEEVFGPAGTRETQDFYTEEYPSRAGTRRKSKAKAKKRDKRYKYSPLEKM